MTYCSSCGKELAPGAAFCASCGAQVGAAPAGQQPRSAMQGLAQSGLEVQAFNGALVVGRILGLVAAGLLLWFVVGPALEKQGLLLLVAIFGLAAAGLLAGQWVTLLLLRR